MGNFPICTESYLYCQTKYTLRMQLQLQFNTLEKFCSLVNLPYICTQESCAAQFSIFLVSLNQYISGTKFKAPCSVLYMQHGQNVAGLSLYIPVSNVDAP